MKKSIFAAIVMTLIMSSTVTFARTKDVKPEPETSAIPVAETKLSEEEVTVMRERIEEIRDMDKSEMNVSERKELKNEVKGIKKDIKKGGGAIYIGGASLLLIILLIVLLV